MMSKINLFAASLILVLLCLSGRPYNAAAQAIQGEFITGMNLAQVDGDEVVGYRKPGLNAGVGAALPLGKNWSVSIETLFSQKGAYKKYPENTTNLSLPYYNLRLNYAEIPLMIHYNDKDQITGGIGFSYGRLVSMKEVEHGTTIDWQTSTGPYDRDDYEVILDVRFRLYWKLHLDFRYAYSMSKIRTRDYTTLTSTWTRHQYNNLLTMRLIFIFNEKLK